MRRKKHRKKLRQKVKTTVNRRLFWAIIVSAFGSGFQHGYHAKITNISEDMFKEWITKWRTPPPSDLILRLLWLTCVVVYLIGGIIGGMMVAIYVNKYGEKGGLLWNNIIIIFGLVITVVSGRVHSVPLFIIGRFIIGINSGLSGGLCQMYLTDIASVGSRGFVCGFYQLFKTIGNLTAECSGLALGTLELWPILFIASLVLAVVHILALPFIPESPKHLLIIKEDDDETKEALKWLRKSNDVSNELEQFHEEDRIVKELEDVSFTKMFTDIKLRSPLLICVMLGMANQLCDMDTIISLYLSHERSKIGTMTTVYLTLAFSIMNVVVTLFALIQIDAWGRRQLLLLGFMGLAVVTIGISVCLRIVQQNDSSALRYVAMSLMYLGGLVFAPGIGTIPWFITAELFFYTVRALAVTIATTANWTTNFLVKLIFEEVERRIGPYAILGFAALDIIFFTFTFIYLPETARRSSIEIIEIYHR